MEDKKTDPAGPRYLTTAEVAEEFRLSLRTLRRYAGLPAGHLLRLDHKRGVNGRILFKRAWVEEWLERLERHRRFLKLRRSRHQK